MIVLTITTMAWAGMIEFTDDDPDQKILFYAYDSTLIDSVKLHFSLDLDSGFVSIGKSLSDSVLSADIGYCNYYDQYGMQIPGVYHCEYWYFEEIFLKDGSSIVCNDTTHITADFTIQPNTGCGAVLIID